MYLFLIRLIASTQKIDPSSIGIKDPVKDANAAVTGILNTVYAWAGIVCVLVIIVSGYMYVTSTADPQKTKQARYGIIGAVVGLVIIMSAFIITQYVIGSV